MPRDGSGVASAPPGTVATPNTTILSSAHNNLRNDIYAIFNQAWPVALGGTGGTSPDTARVALGLKPVYDAYTAPTTTVAASFAFLEGTDNGANKVLLKAADALTADRTITFPDASGTLALAGNIAGKTDVRRNRIVNHDMRMSQENGTTAGTGNGFYPVDQWAQYRVTSAGTLTVQQVASVTPAGSPNRIRATVTTADTSLAAGEYWTISQNLEGSNVTDFQYGGANAKQSVLRFGFKGPAGTYAAALHNNGATRSYVALFTISAGQANTDTVQTIVIPGDTTGTLLTADGVIGLTLDIVLAAGTTFQGTTGWQNGNILATSAVTNGMGTGSSVFELFDVGLRLDPDATGVYGQYEVAETDAVYRSERYWWSGTFPVTRNVNASSGVLYVTVSFPVKMAKAPAGTAANGTIVTPTNRDFLQVSANVGGTTNYEPGAFTANARLS